MIGEQFGNYKSISLLGEGGMGAVYLAEHPGIGRRVAVKVLHREYTTDEQLLGRLLNEARAANAIRHPNIIEILDSGMRPDGTPFLVMELLEGESLGGKTPFVSEGCGDLVNMHLNVPPQSILTHRQSVPDKIDALVLKMLAKNPEDRYPDMTALQGALRVAGGTQLGNLGSSPDI